MKIVQHGELDNIELYYNHTHTHTVIENGEYELEIIFNPFAYEHQPDNNVRRIVLMWLLILE